MATPKGIDRTFLSLGMFRGEIVGVFRFRPKSGLTKQHSNFSRRDVMRDKNAGIGALHQLGGHIEGHALSIFIVSYDAISVPPQINLQETFRLAGSVVR